MTATEWHAAIRPVKLEGATPLFLITAIPDRELMASAQQLMRHSLIATVLVILLAIPITWGLARGISGPLRQLAVEAEAIRRFEFSQPIKVESLVLEVNDLTVTMDSMKRTIRRFLDISMAVAAENDFDRLLPRLLTETMLGRRAPKPACSTWPTTTNCCRPRRCRRTARRCRLQRHARSPQRGRPAARRRARRSNGRAAGRLTADDMRALGLAAALPPAGASHAIAVPLLNRQHQLVGAMLLLCRRRHRRRTPQLHRGPLRLGRRFRWKARS